MAPIDDTDHAAPTTRTPLVSARAVTRRYGPITALDAVDVDIHENEFFALLGPSGCGKTTLLRILAGLDQPDSGSITLDGADLLAMPVHRRPVNLMFQSYALFPHMTVAKNVGYGLARDKVPGAELKRRVDEVLEVVGLGGLGHRKPAQLSGGQRQRVALARAVVKRPRLLLLDEPLAALDRKIRAQMQTELKRLQHEFGITFVIVTHDQEEAMSMADRIAVMNQGRIEQLATPTALYERPATRFVADFIGSTNLFDAIGDDGVRRSGSLRPERVGLAAPGSALPAGHTVVAGTVADVQFYGGVSHVMVAADGHDRPLVAAEIGATRWTPGDPAVVHWNPADVVTVADDQPEPEPRPPGDRP